MARIEWKTQEEIEREQNAPKLPTMEERLEAVEAALLEMIFGGVTDGSVSGGTGKTGENHS